MSKDKRKTEQRSTIEASSLSLVQALLSDFDSFLGARSLFALLHGKGGFNKILEWHYRSWQEDRTGPYWQIGSTLSASIKKIETRALREKEAYSFFSLFKTHVEHHRNEAYLADLFPLFYEIFFEEIKQSPERFDIWHHYFPVEWKITRAQLEDPNNLMARLSFNEVSGFIQKRIWEITEGFDVILEEVARELFPEVDPLSWAIILIFFFTPYDRDNRVKSVIEKPWTFGKVGRVQSYWSSGKPEDEEQHREHRIAQAAKERINAYDLALFLFEDTFSRDNLLRYLDELNNLTYGEDTAEESRRIRILTLFRDMLDAIDKGEIKG